MKKQKREKLKKLLDVILKESFKNCKNDEDSIAESAQKINQAAYECLKHIEYEPEEIDN
jgi:hypothetical protein